VSKILVVDDDKDVVQVLKLLLERDGHTVTTAHDGRDALGTLGTELPDLVLMDVVMPGMDGYTLQSQLLGSSKTKGIPIVVVSGNKSFRQLFALADNVRAYLEKPFSVDTLRSTVEAAMQPLGRAAQQAALAAGATTSRSAPGAV
jgi:twitching motility two-component system response regulator PilH